MIKKCSTKETRLLFEVLKKFQCESVQIWICTNIPGFVENLPYENDQKITITFSEFPAITKSTPANHVPEIFQPQHYINTSTNPESCHMSNFIRQNEVNTANEALKVEKPVLESSSEMDKLQCITNTEHSPDTKITVMGTRSPAQDFQVMESFN